ncbi:MAG: PAS domain-containing protein [Planctomycetes bacterium]|nr:PAS domain-containing protein [Planctomycetota bacterium]
MTVATRFTIRGVTLVATAAAAAWYALALIRRGGPHTINDHAIALTIAGSAGALAAAVLWYLRRYMQIVVRELETMASTGQIGLVMGDGAEWARPLIGPINRVLTRCRDDLDKLRAQNREVQIQARVTDAEKQHTEAIIHSISDAVIVSNRFDEMTLANEAAASLFGFSLAGALRKKISHVLADDTLARLISETRSHGSSTRRRVVSHTVDRDGAARSFDVTLSCITGGRDDVSGVVAVLHDVTKEKEVAQMKTDFVSNVSHELRTPLAGIKAYIEMLLDGDAEDPQTRREFHEIIAGETDRLSRLIDNILNLARIESGVVKVAVEPMDLTAVVKSTLEVAAPQAKAKSIELVESLAPVFTQVEADRDMINQAVMNLVSNAIKYTREGGTVRVATRIEDHRGVAVVEVADSGVGIPAEDLPHLFDKFYRVKSSCKMAKGTGLGLALVKHIVETLHRGSLTVRSTVGENSGSVFTIELPICS